MRDEEIVNLYRQVEAAAEDTRQAVAERDEARRELAAVREVARIAAEEALSDIRAVLSGPQAVEIVAEAMHSDWDGRPDPLKLSESSATDRDRWLRYASVALAAVRELIAAEKKEGERG
jgi:hypothetical protein